MNDVAVIVRNLRFPCEPWIADGMGSLRPVRGTWTLAPVELWMNKGIHGVLCCPQCAKCALLTHDMGKMAEQGVREIKEFRCSGCGFVCNPMLEDWDLRKLYCIAWETYEPDGKVIPHKDYMHAVSEEECRLFFDQSHLGQRYHIVAAAPVVGYFAADKDGKDLRVD